LYGIEEKEKIALKKSDRFASEEDKIALNEKLYLYYNINML